MFKNGNYIGEGGDGGLEMPSTLQQLIDYDGRTDGQPVYIGFAERGAQTSDGTWLIQQFTYININGIDYLEMRQSAVGAWDDRATTLAYA